jgi:hypothetical protein
MSDSGGRWPGWRGLVLRTARPAPLAASFLSKHFLSKHFLAEYRNLC